MNHNNNNKSTTISPAVSSGFTRQRVPIFASILGLAIFYNALCWFLKDSTWLRPADEFCKNETTDNNSGTTKCSRPDLFAFQVVSAIMNLYMGGIGLWTWHITKKVVTDIPQTPEGRLFGYLKEADLLNAGIFVYQTLDFFLSMFVPEHATAIFLTHHLLTAICAWMSLEYQMVPYYAVYFGGCSEISTMFLVLVDFDFYFPAEDRGSLWGIIITVCQGSFALSFLYYRIIGWWQVSFQMWSDVFYVAKKGRIEEYRPGKGWFLYGFLVMDFLLGSLQVYWFAFEILPKILEVLA